MPRGQIKKQNKEEEVENMWTSRDVCDFLHIGRDTLTDLIKNRKLPARRFGNAYRYFPAQVRIWAEAQE